MPSDVAEVSVVTCVRNQQPQFFRDAARSVRELKALTEWLLVDDGSDEQHHDVYRLIIKETELIEVTKILRLAHSIGLAAARNVGFAHAQGEWIVVLDSDDLLAPNLGTVLRETSSEIGLVCCSAEYFSDARRERRSVQRWAELYARFGKTSADPFLWFDFYYHGIIARSTLVKKIGGYTSALEVGEDQDVLLRACEALSIGQVLFWNDISYFYRQNPYGVCSTRWQEVEENYLATMLSAATRRGAAFEACRYAETAVIDDAAIDVYQYRENGCWLDWEQHSNLLGLHRS